MSSIDQQFILKQITSVLLPNSENTTDLLLHLLEDKYDTAGWLWNEHEQSLLLSPRFAHLFPADVQSQQLTPETVLSLLNHLNEDSQNLLFASIQTLLNFTIPFSITVETVETPMRRFQLSGKILTEESGKRIIAGTVNIRGEEHTLPRFGQCETLWDLSPIGMMLFNSDGIITHVNKTFTRQFESSAIELIGTSGGNVIHSIHSPRYNQKCKLQETCLFHNSIQNAIHNNQTTYRLDIPIDIKVDDAICLKWLRMDVVPINLDDGSRALAAITDITNMKEWEFYLDEIQNVSNIGAYTLSFTTGIWEPTPVLCEIFGIDSSFPCTVEGWNSLVHPDEQKDMLHYFQNDVIEKKEAFDKVYRIVRPSDQEVRWVYGRGHLQYDPNQHLVSMIGTIQDITEQKALELELTRRSSYLKNVLEISGCAIFEFDSEGIVRNVNDFAEQIYGYTHEEMMGQPISFFDPQITRNQIEQIIQTVPHLPEPLRMETVNVRNDGSLFDVEISIGYIKHNNGSYISFVRDISDRKEAYRQLEESRNQIDRIVQNLGDKYALFSHTPTGTFLYVSEGFSAIFGTSVEESIGMDWRLIQFDEESLTIGEEADKRIITEHTQETIQLRFYHPLGEWRYVEITYGPVLSDDNEVVKIEGICVDITDRIKQERALKQEQGRLIESQQVAKLGNWELDIRNNKLHWSEEIFSIFEIPPEQFNQSYESFLNLIHPEDRELVNKAYAKSLEEKRHYSITHRLLMTDGRVKYVHEQARHSYAPDGTPLYSSGTVQDITDQTEKEQERLALQKQLYQAQKMDAIGKLAGGVAHDFNNMLSVILGHAEELLSDPEVPAPYRESLQEIHKAAKRSAGLTRQLLAFSRQETILPRQLDLNSIVEGMLKMLKRLIGENIEIQWNPASKPLPVFMDPGQIDQILANLCVNARDAIEDCGEIEIATGVMVPDETLRSRLPQLAKQSYVTLSIRDSGAGIDREVLANIFDPFFTTKEIGKGTGLGLATVYGIIQQNDGAIDVTSSLDRGTIFTVYIPQSAEKASVRRTAASHTGNESESHERILIVEDEKMVLKTITAMLTRNGYDVIGFEYPGDAIAAIEQGEKFDLLISDVIMPDINGKELVAAIRALQPQIKVLFMSGYTDNVISEHGILDEGVEFIQKPIELRKLLQKIRLIMQA